MHQPLNQEAAAVLAAGVDWITCTAATPARSELLAAVGWAIAYGEADAGNDLRPWSWMGYSGVTSGGASVGQRSDGVICRLSSGCAADHWIRPASIAEHVSRLDLAVTVRLLPEENPAAEAYRLATQAGAGRRGRSIQRATHIETLSEGETCYLGSRKSARFGRLYNKGLESKEEMYRDCWRWEVEYKEQAATPVAVSVAKCGNQASAVLAYVWDAFASWGSPPGWGVDATIPPGVPARQPNDDERRLGWLYRQVRPVISRLVSHGRRTEVLSALGLDGEAGE